MHDRPGRPPRRTRTQPPPVPPPLTMQDVIDAMLLADDRGILLCRDQLPDDAGTIYDHDSGILYVDPRLDVADYCRHLVDGIHHVADLDRPARPALALVAGDGDRDMLGAPAAQAAG